MEREKYYIYVVELDEPWKVYVGSSVLTPEDRFARHKQGGMTTSRFVRKHGKRLRPELYLHLNPYSSREAAQGSEQRLASRLTTAGYEVFGSSCPQKRKNSCFGI